MTDLAEMKRLAESAINGSPFRYDLFHEKCTPAAVLKLIARVEKAEGRLEGKFGGINLEYAEENAKLEAENAKLRAVVSGFISAFEKASEERYAFMDTCETEARKWKAENDMCGWNFHQGMAGGANWVDIFYRKAFRQFKESLAALDAKPKETT